MKRSVLPNGPNGKPETTADDDTTDSIRLVLYDDIFDFAPEELLPGVDFETSPFYIGTYFPNLTGLTTPGSANNPNSPTIIPHGFMVFKSSVYSGVSNEKMHKSIKFNVSQSLGLGRSNTAGNTMYYIDIDQVGNNLTHAQAARIRGSVTGGIAPLNPQGDPYIIQQNIGDIFPQPTLLNTSTVGTCGDFYLDDIDDPANNKTPELCEENFWSKQDWFIPPGSNLSTLPHKRNLKLFAQLGSLIIPGIPNFPQGHFTYDGAPYTDAPQWLMPEVPPNGGSWIRFPQCCTKSPCPALDPSVGPGGWPPETTTHHNPSAQAGSINKQCSFMGFPQALLDQVVSQPGTPVLKFKDLAHVLFMYGKCPADANGNHILGQGEGVSGWIINAQLGGACTLPRCVIGTVSPGPPYNPIPAGTPSNSGVELLNLDLDFVVNGAPCTAATFVIPPNNGYNPQPSEVFSGQVSEGPNTGGLITVQKRYLRDLPAGSYTFSLNCPAAPGTTNQLFCSTTVNVSPAPLVPPPPAQQPQYCGNGVIDPGEQCDPPLSLCSNGGVCYYNCHCPSYSSPPKTLPRKLKPPIMKW